MFVGYMSAEWRFLVTLNERLRPLKDPVEIQEAAVRLIGEHLEASRVNYARIEGEEFVVTQSYARTVPPFAGRGRLARLGTTVVDACRLGETVVVSDASADPRLAEAERAQLLAGEMAAFVAVPLTKEGRWVALFSVHSVAPRAWTRDQIALVEVAAERTWLAGERARAEEALRRRETRQAFLRALNETVRPLADPARILAETCRLLGTYLGVNRVCYGDIEGDDCTVVDDYVDGVPSMAGRFRWTLLAGTRLDEILKGGALVSNDTWTDPDTAAEREALQAAGIGAYLCPLLIKDGRFVAAFGVHNKGPRVWSAEEIALVEDVAERIWTTLEYRKAESELRANEERLEFLLRLNDALRPLSDPGEVQETAAGLLGRYLGATRVVYAEIDGSEYAIHREYAHEVPPLAGQPPRAMTNDRIREALRCGETVVVDDFQRDPRLGDEDRAALRARQVAAFILTARVKTGRIVAVLGVNHAAPRAWTAPEAALVSDVAQRTWDAVERARAERMMEEARGEQREAEHDRALRTLLETATQGIVSVDAQGVIASANHAFAAMFGWPCGELVGQGIEGLMPSAFRDGPARRGDPHRMGVRRDGSTFPFEVSVNHVPTPGGPRAFAFVTDITDRERAAAALQERTAELEYRTTQLSRMASDVTLAEQHAREQLARTLHDGLQQLLVIAAVNVDQHLKREGGGEAARSELLSEARQALEEAITAARSLTYELFTPVLQEAGLPAALAWLGNWTRDRYPVEVRVTADPRADSGRKDVRTLLFESARELLFNAVKHAQADRVTLELDLDADDRLCITVADEGVGFDPAALAHRSQAGLVGWGLFSIRERVTLLGGSFQIDSAPGRGTRVRLVAPRGQAQAGDGPTGSRPASAGDAPGTSARRPSPEALQVLIVDDYAAFRRALRESLDEHAELRVVGEASDGVEAIALAHSLRPDVVVMDVAMPRMDGVEATARIRAELPDIQVVGLSMRPVSGETHPIEQAGAARFFEKGTDTQRLIQHLLSVHASQGAGVPAKA